jgi:dihydropyrimidinase
MKDQKEMGLGDFSKIPNGIGTVEHRVDLLYQGVVDGKLDEAVVGDLSAVNEWHKRAP